MKKKRIWFNRWFSTGIHFIDKIREGDKNNEYEIFVTHHKHNKEYKKRADHFSIEKYMRGKEYVEFCIDYCKTNKIDIFIPKFCLYEISENRDKFEEIGVKVMIAADHKLVKLLNNKALFSKDCNKYGIVDIPEYYNVHNVAEFEDAYKLLKKNNKTVCYKPAVSEGGLEFRVVYGSKEENERYKLENRISYSRACKVLKKKGSFNSLMVMEFLDGIEYSIDCLAKDGNLLMAIPRKKVGWYRMLENNAELIKIAKEITEKYGFSYVYNIQVRYSNGIPKLLEVNPRMSGGLNTSCMSGVNFPYLALRLLENKEIELPVPDFSIVEKLEETSNIGKV